ncbi:hypothetical protein HPB52_004553 [Rhipicephalus sanguineus]|uniref:Uncharacterized protein n=1 Tax=Rhipicephalus sanguineus TaxID=34632 RepID=A0A9D4SXJ9_RHISA|nr:hypothetical protein HPB52_004553 [Rhipicephalus sanguineus]
MEVNEDGSGNLGSDHHQYDERQHRAMKRRPMDQELEELAAELETSVQEVDTYDALIEEMQRGDVKVAVPAVSTRQLVQQQEKEEWVRTAEKKSSITVYRMGKRDIAKEAFFDNS